VFIITGAKVTELHMGLILILTPRT